MCSFETQRNGLVFIYDMAGSNYTNFELDLSKKILNLLKVRKHVLLNIIPLVVNCLDDDVVKNAMQYYLNITFFFPLLTVNAELNDRKLKYSSVFLKLCCISPPGGVPCQAEESVDRWRSRLVQSALQSAQPAAEREAEGEGEMMKMIMIVFP